MMWASIRLRILFGICFLAGLLCANAADPDPLLSKAKAAYNLRDFTTSIHLCNRLLQQASTSDEDRVVAHALLGAVHSRTGEYEKALAALNKGLAIASSMPDSGVQVIDDLWFQLAGYYDRIGHGKESLSFHEKALRLRLTRDGTEGPSVAESYNGLGELYLYTYRDYRKAKYYLEQALSILQKDLPEDNIDLYFPHFMMAHASRYLGDNDRALVHAFKALSIVKSRPDYNLYLERCYTLLGDIYYSQADFANAVSSYESGISESIRHDGPGNFNLIQKYTNLGVAYSETGELVRGISSLRRSLAIAARHRGGHHVGGENFLHLGRIYQKLGKRDSALTYLRNYVVKQRLLYGDHHPATSEAHRYLARFFKDTRYYDSAAQHIQLALVSAIPGFDDTRTESNPPAMLFRERDVSFLLFADKASVLLSRHLAGQGHPEDLQVALRSFQVADSLMRRSRSGFQSEGSKLFIADHYHQVYEEALNTCYLLFKGTGDERYVEEAFMFMERSKALLLAEALRKAELYSRAGVPDSLREIESGLSSALIAYRSELEHVREEQLQTEIRARIFEYTQRQERLFDTISQLYPSYFQAKYEKVLPLTEVRSYVRDNNASILEYLWGDTHVFAVAMSDEALAFDRIAITDSLRHAIEGYFKSLEKPSWKENDGGFASFVSDANLVYETLVKPFSSALTPPNLIVVRDGPLLILPFESMIVAPISQMTGDYGALDYLIRHKAVSYAHSADILLKAALPSHPPATGRTVLAFAYAEGSTGEFAQSPSGMRELPGAAAELAAIEEMFSGTFLLGDKATEGRFKKLAPEYDIIHLAVHGTTDPESQFSSRLYFRKVDDEAEDGQLHVHELYDLALKARLAVLSACESGSGKIFRGEGVFSIARGFAYAGCPSTVMTLWPVSDEVGADIMRDFYTRLKNGDRIDEALRDAKVSYLRDAHPQLAHPSYWASYIATGNMDPVVSTSSAQIVVRIAAVLLISVVVLGLLRRVLVSYARARRSRTAL